ncbi:hypothetical protein AWZ03_013101 [Drosophila navojoa]|uniref:Uncharacterized protein n=1 Tax=Drosophila navojoa TaxID=7232 RepID=A0A484AVR0_DRONA|nr:hypothetical protein AWZ03_013101 [Drosophila navojoa]
MKTETETEASALGPRGPHTGRPANSIDGGDVDVGVGVSVSISTGISISISVGLLTSFGEWASLNANALHIAILTGDGC